LNIAHLKKFKHFESNVLEHHPIETKAPDRHLVCDVTPLSASSQVLLPDRGESRGSSFPCLKGSDLPHFRLEQNFITYLSLGLKNGNLGGRQLVQCISGEKIQQGGGSGSQER